MKNIFLSQFHYAGEISFPDYSGIRILQMPIIMGDLESIPDFLSHWLDTFKKLFDIAHVKAGIGYITIDEKLVKKGESHRRRGLHVDGVYQGSAGCTFGGGSPFGTVGDGMYLVSSEVGCRAWNQEFSGRTGYDGECDHLLSQCKKECETIFEKNSVYWVDGLCVHESMPMMQDTFRQMVRLTMPNDKPWFDGFTLNPKGVKHTGKMMPRRTQFMDN